MREQLNTLRSKLSGGASRWLLLGAVLVTVWLAATSVVDIEPGEVAVRVNNVTGGQTAITTPGWTIRLPFVHSVHIEDAKPHSFTMSGDRDRGELDVLELTVRASDGSNFRFSDTTIIFQLAGADVVAAVRDAGTGNAFPVETGRKEYEPRTILRIGI